MMRLRSAAAQGLAELAVAVADGDRLSRGRTYHRKGLVRDVDVAVGVVWVVVGGSSDDPYTVSIAVKAAGDNVTTEAAANPAAAVPGPGDIGFSCTCPDWGDPCKHGVAALLAFAQEVDDDVSLLLRWRGIDGIVVPPPPGTESLLQRAAAPSRFDPDADDAPDRGNGRWRRRFGSVDPDVDHEIDFGGDLDDLDADAVFRALVRGADVREADEDDLGEAMPLVPDPGDAVRSLRRRLGPAPRSIPGTPRREIAPIEGLDRTSTIEQIRRHLDGVLTDPNALGARTPTASADPRQVPIDDGALAAFFDGPVPDAIGSPIPLGEDQLDAYHLVRIPIENIDAAPVIADALDTIADHWLTR